MKFFLLANVLIYIFHNAASEELPEPTERFTLKGVFKWTNTLKVNVTLITRELSEISQNFSAFVMMRLGRYKTETVRLIRELALQNLNRIKVKVEKDMNNQTFAQECYELAKYHVDERIDNFKTNEECDPIDLKPMHTFVANVTATIQSGDDLIENMDKTSFRCCSRNTTIYSACVHKNFANWRKEFQKLKENRKTIKTVSRFMHKQPNHFKCFGSRVTIFLEQVKKITDATDECFQQLSFVPLAKLNFTLNEESSVSVRKVNSTRSKPVIL